jgi:hypothetical protein
MKHYACKKNAKPDGEGAIEIDEFKRDFKQNNNFKAKVGNAA